MAFSIILVPIFFMFLCKKKYHFASTESNQDFREFSCQQLKHFSVISCQGEQSDATYQSTDAGLDNPSGRKPRYSLSDNFFRQKTSKSKQYPFCTYHDVALTVNTGRPILAVSTDKGLFFIHSVSCKRD